MSSGLPATTRVVQPTVGLSSYLVFDTRAGANPIGRIVLTTASYSRSRRWQAIVLDRSGKPSTARVQRGFRTRTLAAWSCLRARGLE